jgi:hypothetical protein
MNTQPLGLANRLIPRTPLSLPSMKRPEVVCIHSPRPGSRPGHGGQTFVVGLGSRLLIGCRVYMAACTGATVIFAALLIYAHSITHSSFL